MQIVPSFSPEANVTNFDDRSSSIDQSGKINNLLLFKITCLKFICVSKFHFVTYIEINFFVLFPLSSQEHVPFNCKQESTQC